MAWDERTVEQMREEFVRRVLAQERSKAALCREYGISRPTGDKEDTQSTPSTVDILD